MSTAVFKKLTGEINGLLRVYDTDDAQEAKEPAEYKFFTGVEITGDIATIYGMRKSDINRKDQRAMDRELSPLGVRVANWTHDGKPYSYVLKSSKSTQKT